MVFSIAPVQWAGSSSTQSFSRYVGLAYILLALTRVLLLIPVIASTCL